jgi:hypothetical protein
MPSPLTSRATSSGKLAPISCSRGLRRSERSEGARVAEERDRATFGKTGAPCTPERAADVGDHERALAIASRRMEPRRRWGTAFVVASVIAFGGVGAAYLWKESQTQSGDEAREGALVADASADARVARGKRKPGKKGARAGKPRGGGGRISTGPGGGGTGNGNGGGGTGNGGGNVGADDNESADDNGGADDPPPPPPFRGRGPAGPTYEAALASNTQEITIGKQGAADLTDAQLSGPMRSGAFAGECGAPDSMKVTVKVAIKTGRAAGVSVSTSPPDPDVAGCIDRYVRTFSWPSSSKMDSFTTTY